MPLSEYEQRVLEQMERQLTSDDPKLASSFQGRARSGVRRWLLAAVGALVGIVVLVIGAMENLPLLGVLGFVAMFASIVLAFTPGRRTGPEGVVKEDGNVRRAPRPATPSGGFLSRLEERWDRRREERGR